MSHNKLTHKTYLQKLSEQNRSYFKGDFKIVSKYSVGTDKILIQTKYGICKFKAKSLLQGHAPTIVSAINKTDYIKNMFVEKWGELFSYDKVIYINARTKVEVICHKHGSFSVTPDNHLSKKSGCPKCKITLISKINKENPTGWSYTDWENQGQKSKHFNSFKVYIIKCWNDDEEFYKIGKTFTTVTKRFHKNIPYNYEIVRVYEGSAKEMCKLEKYLQNKNKDFKYIPKLKFGGMYECFYRN